MSTRKKVVKPVSQPKSRYHYSAAELAKADKRFGGAIASTTLIDQDLFGSEETFITLVGENNQSSSTRLSAFMGKCLAFLVSKSVVTGSDAEGYDFHPSAMESLFGKATISASKKTGLIIA